MANSLFEKGLCKNPTLGFPFIKGLSPMNEMKSILQYDYFVKFLQLKTSLLEKVFYKSSTNFHNYQMSVTCTSSLPPQARKSCKTDDGVSYRIHSMHKKKMAADKSTSSILRASTPMNGATRVVHVVLAHSNISCMSGVTPGLRIDMVKHSCHSYLSALPLSTLCEWHYSWVR